MGRLVLTATLVLASFASGAQQISGTQEQICAVQSELAARIEIAHQFGATREELGKSPSGDIELEDIWDRAFQRPIEPSSEGKIMSAVKYGNAVYINCVRRLHSSLPN